MEASTNTTGREEELQGLSEQAAGIVAASQSKVGIRQAMNLVGFTREEVQVMKWYQKVRRRSKVLAVVENKKAGTPPGAVEADGNMTATSDLTNSTKKRMSDDDNDESEPSPRRVLNVESPCKSPDKIPVAKKRRNSSKIVHAVLSRKAAAKDANKKAMKYATQLVSKQADLPKKERKSTVAIVRDANKQFSSDINSKTVGRYVREGLIGVSPLKPGPTGHFPKRIYDALCGSYTTFLKLEQAESKKQSNTKKLSMLVNATVNKAGFNETRDDLARKLKRDTAHMFEAGKANIQEARRVQWTTKYNLDLWFSTWKSTLIDLGFAREKLATDKDIVGEVVFFPMQRERILNLDETDGSIDDTTGQRGGRPALTYYAPDVSGGATQVNKSGYSATIICGSNAAGDPLPPHFQLKTAAQTVEREKMSVDWFRDAKKVLGKFGNPERMELPCTYGMNEKAGMNAVELDKYMRNSTLPLYPDIQDVPGKRVIVKVDSGPGRTNVAMLATLRLQGLYVIPGVPNTTGKTQETDQNYGPFKSAFRANIRTLSQARFDKDMTISVCDLPLLVFGGECPRTGVQLIDAFDKAFRVVMNLSVWKKCGSVPLTRAPVFDKGVRTEVAVGLAATRGDMSFADSDADALKRLEAANHFYSDFLTAEGYDGKHLRKDAPKRTTYVAVTVPQSKQRIQAIKRAKTAGQMFFATGGQHLNSDEFFRATELKERAAAIKAMEEKKLHRKVLLQQQKNVVALIKKKGELTSSNFKDFVVKEVTLLLKWKGAVALSTRKADIVNAYVNNPKPKPTKIWTRAEERELQQLKDTAIGVATSQMARAVTNNLANLDEESIKSLRSALSTLDSDTTGTT